MSESMRTPKLTHRRAVSQKAVEGRQRPLGWAGCAPSKRPVTSGLAERLLRGDDEFEDAAIVPGSGEELCGINSILLFVMCCVCGEPKACGGGLSLAVVLSLPHLREMVCAVVC